MKIIITALVGSVLLSGCVSYGKLGMRSMEKGSTGRIFVWDSDYSAGVGKDNNMCVQGAKTASAKALNAALDAIAAEPTGPEAKLKAGISLSESVQALNPSNTQTTYAAEGYFAVCQLAINSNSTLSSEEIVSLFKNVSETALLVDKTATAATTLKSPVGINVIKEILKANNVEPETEEVSQSIDDAIKKLD